MDKPKHTPGPWRLSEECDGDYYQIDSEYQAIKKAKGE